MKITLEFDPTNADDLNEAAETLAKFLVGHHQVEAPKGAPVVVDPIPKAEAKKKTNSKKKTAAKKEEAGPDIKAVREALGAFIDRNDKDAALDLLRDNFGIEKISLLKEQDFAKLIELTNAETA